MKKWLALLLAVLMCLGTAACGGGNDKTGAPSELETPPEPETPTYALRETVSTDIMELTLTLAQPAIALGNTWHAGSPAYEQDVGLPKEYDPAEDSGNPYVASMGRSLVAFSITAKNLDRTTVDWYNNIDTKFQDVAGIQYNGGEGYTVKSVAYISNIERYSRSVSGNISTFDADEWHEGEVMYISAGEEISARSYFDIPAEIDDLKDGFTITFKLPTSQGEKEEFTYKVTEADWIAAAAAAEAENEAAAAEAEAAEAARLAEADPEIVKAVHDYIDDTYVEYTNSGARFKIEFSKNGRVTITASNAFLSYQEKGNFSVRKEVILFEMDNGCTPVMPYTYNGPGDIDFYYIEGTVVNL